MAIQLPPSPTVTITGHRPEKLGDSAWVSETLETVLTQIETGHLIQGMAAGADLLSARVASKLNIPYTAAKPWKTHTPRVEDAELYELTLKEASQVVNVTEVNTYTGPQLYHARNEWMVDRGDVVVAIWDKGSKGGTAAAVRYARKQNIPVIIINPQKQVVEWGELTQPEKNDDSTLTLF